ncbi:ABC transporter permease [Halopenitus sp. H-Gu1]|uniref:ABC transporter permease n=1 Tax=Halopenitus sp. H-Gu1 TaxID=3242697 RepID=UPI00359CD36A
MASRFRSEPTSEHAAVETVSDDELGSIPGYRAVIRIAIREYRIAIRGRWAIGLTALFAIFSVTVVGFGTSEVGPSQYAAVVASLVELGVYLVPLAALTVGYDTVVGAREAGSLDMLFTLPVSQAQVIFGKYLGRLAVLGGAMGIGLGVGGVAATLIGGIGGLEQYALFVIVSVATAGVFLGVSVLLSTLAREKTQALGAALVAWLWFVLLHDLVAIGLIAGTELPDAALTVMALTNPADVYRLLVLSQLETTTGGFAAVLAKASLSVPLLVVALIVWLLAPIVVATVGIRHQPP